MGKSYTSISFVSDDLTIIPHSVGSPRDARGKTADNFHRPYLGEPVRLGDFAGEQRVSVDRLDGGNEYYIRREDGAWLEGPEAD